MNISKINAVFFSPAQSVKRIAQLLVKGMSYNTVPTQLYNLTDVEDRKKNHVFWGSELLIAAAPSYGGRLPAVSPPLFANMEGAGAPAVVIGVYGNRGYDDLLLEMKHLLEGKGFVVVAAAAFVARHALSQVVGAGRPDKDDLEAIQKFGRAIRQKLDGLASPVSLDVPGNFPYKELPPSPPMAPETSDSCIRCMLCYRWCPTNAIPEYSPKDTDPHACVKCHGCIIRCPVSARKINNGGFAKKVAELDGALRDVRNEPELFV